MPTTRQTISSRKPPWQTQKSVTDKTTRKKIYVRVEFKLPSSYLHTFRKKLNSYLILQLVRLHSKVTKKVIFSTYLSITLSFIMKQLFSRKTQNTTFFNRMSRELLDALFESWLNKNVSYFTNIVAEFKGTEGKVTSLERG